MLHRENQILSVEELMYIIYLIMILNVQQVLLKAFLGAIIVAHGPVEMSFGCFCCNQNRGIFILALQFWERMFSLHDKPLLVPIC